MNPLVVETERLLLREIKPTDAEFLDELLGDAETMRFWPAPLNREQVVRWIARQQKRYRDEGCGYWYWWSGATAKPSFRRATRGGRLAAESGVRGALTITHQCALASASGW